ncbi:MAG TPA: DUF6600 domain-containing protein [Verrucomicrobiae bacterium]
MTNPPLAPAAVTTDTETVRTIQLPKLTLPATLDQVVKLSQSGADEGVIRAYVEKAAPPYRITGNEIVQLRDLGISQGVIMALIEHSPSAASTGTTEMIGPQNPSQPPAPVETNVAQAPLSEDVAPFYDTLAPYGGWYDVPGYGWCWQPSAVAANPGWRPYCDNGYWLWSDYGWYWNSYYSWGWAPFHYGRWFCHGNGSWYWCPDRTWGSSWVCWRNSSTHCGWAALPPGSHCNGGNWTHHGKHVGANSDFGIHSSHFNFVEHGRFTDRHVGRQTITGSDAQNAIRNSSVVNNYSLSANNRLVNHGMGRETIAAASQTPIRNVTVQELPRGGSALPDRVNRAGRGEVVFRPNAQISVPRATATSISANHGLRPTALASVTPADPTLSRIAPSRGVISGNVAGRQVFPTTSMGSSSRTSISQPRQNGNSLSAPRTASPSIAQNRVYARPSAPASISRAAAPVAGVQRYSAPSAGRSSAPSGGGQSRGSVSRGSGGGGSSHGSGSVSHGSSGGGGGASLRR